MKVLVGCEFSGVVRDAFIARGHDAISCDIIESEKPGPHHVGDVLDFMMTQSWDIAIFHPPCTYLANSGVRWLYGGKGTVRDENRWQEMERAGAFFNACKRAPANRICIENPIIHRHARAIVGAHTQIVHPYWFGHGETKATCLWLTNLAPLTPIALVAGRAPVVHHASPGPERWKFRSRTKPGMAAAFAAHWG